MPQGDRSRVDEIEFKRMLPQMNTIYLGATCFCLIDLSYASRFWVKRHFALVVHILRPCRTLVPLLCAPC